MSIHQSDLVSIDMDSDLLTKAHSHHEPGTNPRICPWLVFCEIVAFGQSKSQIATQRKRTPQMKGEAITQKPAKSRSDGFGIQPTWHVTCTY